VSWDITDTTPMYVLRYATTPEVTLHFYYMESKAETKQLTSAHTLQAEKYRAMELWQQEHRRDMTSAASYSRGLEEQLAAATSKASALDLWQQEHRQEMATAASYSRGLEHQLAAVTSRCNALEAMETLALECAAPPDLGQVNALYAAVDMGQTPRLQ
jgi:post-segregation antitoxin (ccd killing protein)